MSRRSFFGVILTLVLLLLAVGPGLAQGSQPTEPSKTEEISANLAASAPWFKMQVDTPGNTGPYPSVAISPTNGGTYVSYYDATNKELRLAMNRGFGVGNCGPDNNLRCQTVDTAGDVGQYSSIAINPTSGEIGIAYYDATNGRLKYAHGRICSTCRWAIETVDNPLLFPTDKKGRYASLKYHSDGTPHIAYYFENGGGPDALKAASPVSNGGNCGYGPSAGKWQCETVQTGEGVGQYASLALDGAGNRHISYYYGSSGDLWYAKSGSGSNCAGGGDGWLCYPVDAADHVGQYTSLYLDKGNNFHIAYYDATYDKLKYAIYVGSGGNCGVFQSAQCETIDSMPAGTHPLGVSLAEDAAGAPVIAYQAENGSLNIARPLSALGQPPGSGNCGPENPFSTWSCETLDGSGAWPIHRQGDFCSIAVSSSGLATIAYYEHIMISGGNLGAAYQHFQTFLPLVAREY